MSLPIPIFQRLPFLQAGIGGGGGWGGGVGGGALIVCTALCKGKRQCPSESPGGFVKTRHAGLLFSRIS